MKNTNALIILDFRVSSSHATTDGKRNQNIPIRLCLYLKTGQSLQNNNKKIRILALLQHYFYIYDEFKLIFDMFYFNTTIKRIIFSSPHCGEI